MRVELDPGSGFCFGVENAIQKAEEILNKEGRLYCLGKIVHNESEIDRLSKLGMKTIDHEELPALSDVTILIRAHGEPPETYEIAKKNRIKIIDATCPIVSKLQSRVKTCFDEIIDERGQVVIYGNTGHPEVKGLVGQTGGAAIVVNKPEDLKKVDLSKPIYLYAQTTKTKKGFEEIKSLLESKITEIGLDTEIHLMAFKTICGQVSNREPQLEKFAKKHDVVLFFSGKQSSNGKTLFEVCRKHNKRSYFISQLEELNREMIKAANSVGISGATSTPAWLLKKAYDQIREF